MNNINRHNYETFFLLYTDNELSVEEKKAVDEFVEANPDLQEELIMLRLSILKPDHIVFDDKRSLLKNEFISTAMQEKLLLHLDNELTAKESREMDALIKTDAETQKEWEMLLQTKLLAGSPIVFKDKQSLYRKEGGRLVAFPWRKVAAAAIFIGFGIWGGSVYFNRGKNVANDGIDKIVKTKLIPDTVKLAIQKTIAPVESSMVDKVVPSTTNEKDEAVRKVNLKKSSTGITRQSREKIAPARLTKKDLQPTGVAETTNNLPKPYFDKVNSISSNKTVPAYVTHEKQPSGNNDIANNSDNRQDPVNTFASPASFTDNAEENNNRVLFMNEEKIKKTKLGGIFRKVKRVLERNANIKPGGNNIKVANLEFAIQ